MIFINHFFIFLILDIYILASLLPFINLLFLPNPYFYPFFNNGFNVLSLKFYTAFTYGINIPAVDKT